MSLLDIARNAEGAPLDDRGTEFTVGGTVAVTCLGYGAAAWMTTGRIVSLGPKRAEVSFPTANGTYRVHYATLRVLR